MLILSAALLACPRRTADFGSATDEPGPHFHDESATRSVLERLSNANIGAPVTAHNFNSDHDEYRLSGPGVGWIRIDRHSGQLTPKIALDYETRNSYSVTAEVWQYVQTAEPFPRWLKQDSISVTINVIDVVLQFTEGDSTTRSIAEDTPADRNIGSPVTATNFKANLDKYVLRGTDAGSFSLNSKTGQLKTKAALNYEIKANYYVTIGVKEGEQSEDEDSISVRIKVTDGPDITCPYGYILQDNGYCLEWAPQHSGEGGGFGEADTLPPLTSEEAARIASLLTMDRVIFNELLNASNDTYDWVELRNVSDTDIDLSGWQLIVTTSEGGTGIAFPEGAVLPAGELLLFLNTDPNAPDMPLATSESASYHVDEGFTLPAARFHDAAAKSECVGG